MHKVKKYIAEDLKFSNQTIKEMKINSKKFYNKIKERRSIRDIGVTGVQTCALPISIIITNQCIKLKNT